MRLKQNLQNDVLFVVFSLRPETKHNVADLQMEPHTLSDSFLQNVDQMLDKKKQLNIDIKCPEKKCTATTFVDEILNTQFVNWKQKCKELSKRSLK